MNNHSELVRENEIMKELESLHDYGVAGVFDADIVVKYILRRDKKNAEPLVKLDKTYYQGPAMRNAAYPSMREAIDATLKNLGAE